MKLSLRLFVAAVVCLAGLFSVPLKAQTMPDFWWQCDEGDTSYNFNPAVNTDSVGSVVFDSLPCSQSYTMIVVYKPLVDTVESAVWRLVYNDSVQRGLTTKRILLDAVDITYTDTTQSGPIINTLRQSVTDIDTAQRYCRLVLGESDSVESHLKISEVMYYCHKLGATELRKVQTYLAVKYGVTLEPVDHISGTGDTIWRISDNAEYHNRITGVGSDSVYGLLQTQSLSEVEGAVVTLAADNIQPNSYLLTGDDNGTISFTDEGWYERLDRTWKMVGTNLEDQSLFNLQADISEFPGDCDSLVLLLDGTPFFADSIADGKAWYGNLPWPGYEMTFSFGRGSRLLEGNHASKSRLCTRPQNHTEEIGSTDAQTGTQGFSVYPNPSNGHYHIQVSGCESLNVTIYNTHGITVAQFHDSGKTQYHFDGNLPTGNVYYVTIATPEGTQTTKLTIR